MTERSRSKLFETFTVLIDDEEAVQQMLSYFPARDVEEPVTKEHLRAEMADLRAEMHQEFRRMQAWTFATVVTANGILFAALKLV